MREYVGILNFFIYRATKPYARISIEWLQMLRDAIVTHTEPEDEPFMLVGTVTEMEAQSNQIALRKIEEWYDSHEYPQDHKFSVDSFKTWLQQEDK